MSEYLERITNKLVYWDKKQLLYRLSREIYLRLASSIDENLHNSKPTTEQLEAIAILDRNLIKQLHVVGNSHAHAFTGSKLGSFGRGEINIFPWNSYSLGPLSSIDLIGRKWGLFEDLIVKQCFKQGDGILLPFGEAECRWYSIKDQEARELNQASDAELLQLIKPYLAAAIEGFARISNLGFQVFTWSGHISMAPIPREDAIVPIYGDLDIRTRLGEIWRDAIFEISLKEGYKFLDFMKKQLELNSSNWNEILSDDIHIDSKFLAGFMLGSINFNAFNK
jgi:hypothetical protein